MSRIASGAFGVMTAVGLMAAGGFAWAQSATDYRIGPLDGLDITVFQVKELTLKKVRVDAAGQLRLPLIGAVKAAGRTPDELSADIAQRLGETYLQSPQVSVVVAEAVSQKVSVEGDVNEAGVFALSGRTGLLEMIAKAKGEARTGDPRRVAIVRSVDGAPHVACFDLLAIRAGRARDPEVVAGDTIVVDASARGRIWRNIVETLPALVVFSYL